MGNVKSSSFRIGGMTCINCQNRIEKKLKSTVGVEDAAVNFTTGMAVVTYNPSVITLNEITAAILQLDYQVINGKARKPVMEIVGTLVIILSLYVLLRGLGISTLSSAFPLAEAGMGYGMLFVIGLITSVHCVAMCGGINLSQCISAAVPAEENRRRMLFPSILYNAGRVISYTIVGILVGALGSAISVSGRFQGVIQLAAGFFMVIMGLNMLGLFQGSAGTILRRFNLRLPQFFARKIDKQKAGNKNPLFIGLLNGLMPCGPLQAMQLYALSTGNPIAGGISMFLFSMGTVPLMFGLGALSSALGNTTKGPAFTRRVMKTGAILVTVMGMTMFTYGLNLSGFSDPLGSTLDFADKAMAAINPVISKASWRRNEAVPPASPVQIEKGVQLVNSTLSGGRYPAITVQAGIPVRWTINAPAESINGCNNRMIIREYGIEYRFKPGENVIEFTPERTGKFSYSCWMGMIRSSITVSAEGVAAAEPEVEPDLVPIPAGVAIPTDTVALAEMRDGYQLVSIQLRDDGIEPAIMVIQKSVPTAWVIHHDSLDPGNDRLIFPAYYTQIDMEPGENVIELMPTGDFDFSTADNVFYGYVKVVEDLNTVDMDEIKGEVAEHETLIYPDAYFEAAAPGGSCCGR
ncbi:MAG: sulfite exporter TauE/SafE family protein [Spirochaetaceae bacterium]|jgi:sulfite exporter TauE/SafE/copper chaperone CopZ/plastocyanin domain-containing protein|nr:sulfite exporter TauE/SafE family protein [Spirochaetaceae bacterium]